MSLYTRYGLTAEPATVTMYIELGKLVTEADLLTEEEFSRSVAREKDVVELATKMLVEIDKENYDPFEEDCRWYEHEADMRRVSLSFEDVLFSLHGEGEGRYWNKYFRNGRMQACPGAIVYPAFDGSKLA